MTITSTAFQDGEPIPPEYACDGNNVNPPLTFSEVPAEAGSLVVIVDDPDAPDGIFSHWLLYDLSPATLQILQDTPPETGAQGTNDFAKVGYGGPCPPDGTHRYYFKLYALKTMLNLGNGATRKELDAAMQDQVLDSAELMGTYQKS